MLNRNLNEEFEIFKRNAADKSISCEIVVRDDGRRRT
jgi:hypothetical protein